MSVLYRVYPAAYGIPIALLCMALLASGSKAGPIADGSKKFLGNVTGSNPPSNFADYWNQVTLENSGKWALVQSSQNSFNWTATDAAYKYCKEKGFPYKHHCFIWGNQYPRWLIDLSADQQKAAVEKWIKTYGERYPETDFIDVVNEPMRTQCPFKACLGDSGSTGWDWVVTSFELARKYCPKAKLLINEYSVENNVAIAAQYLKVVKILQEKNLIDGIGIQSHCFNIQGRPLENIKQCLDTLASSGLPLYSSEFDITGDEAAQLKDYQNIFPVFWEHPAVKGVTLWGWTTNWKGGVIMKDGVELAALRWLRQYVDSLEGPLKIKSAASAPSLQQPAQLIYEDRGVIRMRLAGAQDFSLHVIDPCGRIVFSCPRQSFTAGDHTISMPSRNMSRGLYLITIKGNKIHMTRKVFAGL